MGSALAVAHAQAGNKVIIGSRDETRAKEHATSLSKKLPNEASSAGLIEGMQNKDACDKADVVFLVFGDYQGVKPVSFQQTAGPETGLNCLTCTRLLLLLSVLFPLSST